MQVKARRYHLWALEDSVQELGRLARTANAEVVCTFTQHLEKPSPSYLGKGKLQELRDIRSRCPYDVVLVNDELTPIQQRNLEESLDAKVIDRTALILDIFASHAHTREGRLQVELAQLQYLLPRLVGQWTHLERLGGGIGTRGPGEAQLETDRRIIQRRIQKLKRELGEVRAHRSRYRQRRQRSNISVVSLVGYTNAGKSSLLNTLSGAGVLVQDQLFSTLDPVTRLMVLPNGRRVLMTDTVGFIQKLPPILVAAFRATLEELEEADVIVHVVDITHPNSAEQVQEVENVLSDLGLDRKPVVLAFNKVDLLASSNENAEEIGHTSLDKPIDRYVLISAHMRWGMKQLLNCVQEALELAQG